MTDTSVSDTPALGRWWCPACEPAADPLTEILELHPCARHPLSVAGIDDGGRSYVAAAGNAEAGGRDNRAWCDWLHRSSRRE